MGWDALLILDGLFLTGVVWWNLRGRPAPRKRTSPKPPPPLLPDEEVRFAAESVTLSAEGRRVLGGVAHWLSLVPQWKVVVTGSADDTGHPTRNRRLSRGRAETIRRFLVAQGVAASRVAVVALEPARGLTGDDRARLRRATVKWEEA